MPEAQPLLPLPLGWRADRDTTDILGAGGYLEITRDELQYERAETLKLEVGRWILRPKYYNVEVPCSGSYGAIEKRRLATDFTFAAQVGWDAGTSARTQTVVEGAEGYSTFSPFLDDRFNGFAENKFQVGILFALGEQRQYHGHVPGELADDERGCFYYCRRVQLDDLVIVNSIIEPDIVRGIARGSGSAPLRRYYGRTWLAAGGFNFSEKDQKEIDEAEGVPGTL